MSEFIFGTDLWANCIGGLVTAGVLYIIAKLWNKRRHKILQELIEIMGQAIQHRNDGEQREFEDEKIWIQKAKVIEEKAIRAARKLSPTAGSLVEWLDRVPPWKSDNDVERYISILSTVIERIRMLMEKNA